MNNKKGFHTALAHLFYALIKVDQRIDVHEKKQIVAIVEQQQIDTFETQDDKEYFYAMLRTLIKDNKNIEDAYIIFKNYVIANRDIFTKERSNRVIKGAHKICASFANKNKSELILLARIHKLLLPNEA